MKLVRRRPVLSATVAVALVIAVLLGLLHEQRRQALIERDRAMANEHMALEQRGLAQQSLARARSEEQRTAAVLEFLTAMLDEAEPAAASGRDLTVEEVVDRAAERVSDPEIDDPAVRAGLLEALAGVYTSLGKLDEAEAALRTALDSRRASQGELHSDTLATLRRLVALYVRMDRSEEAHALVARALDAMTGGDDERALRGELEELLATTDPER